MVFLPELPPPTEHTVDMTQAIVREAFLRDGNWHRVTGTLTNWGGRRPAIIHPPCRKVTSPVGITMVSMSSQDKASAAVPRHGGVPQTLSQRDDSILKGSPSSSIAVEALWLGGLIGFQPVNSLNQHLCGSLFCSFHFLCLGAMLRVWSTGLSHHIFKLHPHSFKPYRR